MFFPILYKLTSTGAIQSWQIEVEDNRFRTYTGKLNGKVTKHNWTTCLEKNIGKANALTDAMQAVAEATAKIRLKKKEGYTENLELVRETQQKLVSPMLALPYDEKDALVYPLYVQPKLDGVRCIASSTKLISRKNTEIVSCPHILEALAPVFQEHPELILDGELYNHTLRDNFNKIISLARKTKPTEKDLLASSAELQYWIYDIYGAVDLTFEQRLQLLKSIHKILKKQKNNPITEVETIKVTTQDELDDAYMTFLEEEYEGMMIRTNAGYTHKRTRNLLKRKETISEEGIIVGIIEGIGDRAGGAGKLVVKDADGIEFEANIVGGFELYKQIWNNQNQFLNKECTYVYQNRTPDKKPRFARVVAIFNDTKDGKRDM